MSVSIVPTSTLMQSVVDSKVTRGELLDLIITRVDGELKAEQDKLSAERTALRETFALSLTAAMKLLKGVLSPNIRLEQGNWEHRGTVCLKITATIAPDALPAEYTAAQARKAELDTLIGEVARKRQRLANGKKNARVEMINQSLQSTPEGLKILEAIEGLKATVSARLIAAGTPAP